MAYFKLATALYDQGDEEAINCYRVINKSDFDDAYFDLGNIFLEKGNLDEALQIVSNLKDKMVVDENPALLIQKATD